MKQRFLSTLFFITGAVWAQPLHLIPTSNSEHSLPAINQYGRTSVAAREGFFDVQFPSGKKQKAEVLVVFDPLTKRYAWYFEVLYTGEMRAGRMAEHYSQAALHYILPDRIVLFQNLSSGMFVGEGKSQSKSLASAFDTSLAEIKAQLGDLEEGISSQYHQRFTRIRYLDALGLRVISGGSSGPYDIKLDDVIHTEAGWEVRLTTVSGPAKIILDKDYKVVSPVRNPVAEDKSR